ncbi:MAG: hypothetical protein M0Q90_12810 [Bacteroidales bacterium]|nr:hypothetical protein [Bacteroidales bacterium]
MKPLNNFALPLSECKKTNQFSHSTFNFSIFNNSSLFTFQSSVAAEQASSLFDAGMKR